MALCGHTSLLRSPQHVDGAAGPGHVTPNVFAEWVAAGPGGQGVLLAAWYRGHADKMCAQVVQDQGKVRKTQRARGWPGMGEWALERCVLGKVGRHPQ